MSRAGETKAVSLVEFISLSTNTPMGYIHDFERELRTRLDAGDVDGAVRLAKEKALESYRNGIKAGAEGRDNRRNAAPPGNTQNAGTSAGA